MELFVGIVHVLLVQARGVMAMDGGTCSDPYCKVREAAKRSYSFLNGSAIKRAGGGG